MIDRIEYSIIDQCNLNCAHCCHYAPIAKPYTVTRIQFHRDVVQLGKLTAGGKYLGTLGILGGEPLLHKDFIDLCIDARECLPLSRIRVTTNGLLLNKLTKQQLCILRRFDIEILISKYREEDDFDAMDKLLTEYGIVHKFCNNNELVEFAKYSIDETGSQNPEESHKLCELWKEYYTCHELRDGKLYPCSQIARAESLNEAFGLNLKITNNDYVDIYGDYTLAQIESAMRNTPDYCKYCKVKEWNTPVGKWQKSTKSKEEFI